MVCVICVAFGLCAVCYCVLCGVCFVTHIWYTLVSPLRSYCEGHENAKCKFLCTKTYKAVEGSDGSGDGSDSDSGSGLDDLDAEAAREELAALQVC